MRRNICLLQGRLVKPAEVQENGVLIIVALNENDGENRRTDYVTVLVTGDAAKFAANLDKGVAVDLEGKVRSYQNRIFVQAERVTLLGSPAAPAATARHVRPDVDAWAPRAGGDIPLSI